MAAPESGTDAKRRPAATCEASSGRVPREFGPRQEIDAAGSTLIEHVASTLLTDHRCHAVLVYGSRARGDHTPASDLDIVGLRKGGAEYRWATVIGGVYVDAFVFPDASLRSIGEQHVYMSDAVVVIDRFGAGSKLVAKLAAAARRSPPKLPDHEREVRILWLEKMLARARLDDVEAHYRRAGLHEALLPDYFALRNLRYPGPKRALRWLALHDATGLRLFRRALEEPASLARLERLVRYVTGPEAADAPTTRSLPLRRRARSSSARA